MGVVMVMFRPDGQRRSFSVTRDMTVIGRREDCDLRIPLSDVSRKHCRVILEGEAIKVEDLGSSNGTYRNGERVQQTEIVPGDTLQIGPVIFVVQVDGYPADEDLQPVTAAASAADTATGGAAGLLDQTLIAAAMKQDDESELRTQLAQLRQEHRDLDAAIEALHNSPGADLLQVQRLKKRKLQLRDQIILIEDQLTPDIIA